MKGLIVISHPDDETLFFGGLLQKWRKLHWTVICVTDGGWKNRQKERAIEFEKACAELGVKKFKILNFEDNPEKRLDIARLIREIKKLKNFEYIFTHGPYGEYSHPHHQDVCYATHQAFPRHQKLYSIAYNQFPNLKIQLSKKQYSKKMEILQKVYHQESSEILHQIPGTWVEGFVLNQLIEVNQIYRHLTGVKKIASKDEKAWMAELTHQTTRLKKK